MQPSFFIIGAPKCGTTSITDWLISHPDVCIPQKEIHFFNTDHRRRRRWSLASYEALFEDGKLSGDSSVWYLYSREAVPNILKYNPKARFIVCLRHPVEMAFSLHHQMVFNNDEDASELRHAWSLERERHNGKAVRCYEPSHLFYSQTCALGEQVSRLLTHTSNVHFVFLEDVKSDPRAVSKALQDFLGLSRIDLNLSYQNAASRRRSQSLNRIMAFGSAIKHKLGLQRSPEFIRKVNQWNSVEAPWQRDEPLEKELRRYFHDDIKLLAELTNRNLSHWLEPGE